MLPTECSEQKLLRERYNTAQDAYERAEGIRLLFVRTRIDLLHRIRERGCWTVEEAAGAS
jgi:hypothetical protein